MTTTEQWDVLEWLAQKTGKSAAELYAEQGSTAFADLGAEYLPEGTKVLYDVAGDPFMVINNANGEVIYKTASDAIDSTAGVYASQYATGANAVTTVETVTGETGALTSTLTSGANTAATTAAGKAGATIAGVTMKDAIFGGMAALGGVATGVKWYHDNPEFWTHLSKALLPFAYGDSYKNSGDELADAMNALIPTTVDGNGNTYLPESFMQVLANEMAGITTTETIKPNQNNWNYPSLVSTGTYSGKYYALGNPTSRITMTNVKTAIRGYRAGNYYRGYGVIASDNVENFYIEGGTWGPTAFTYNNKTVHYLPLQAEVLSGSTSTTWTPALNYILYPSRDSALEGFYNDVYKYLAWVLIYGEFDSLSDVEGISKQDGATYPETDKSLQDTYPDWYNQSLQTVNPESTPQNVTYNIWLPVTIPTTDPTQKEGDTTATQPQAQTGENPKDNPNVINKLIYAIQQLTETMTKPDGDTPVLPPTDPSTPTDTGDTPPSIPPVTSGSANGLWKVYNPSEGQLQAFGAWLWSSDIVDQIVKMISNPMNAIIGLHALYATPATGGAQSIKAGYLDSGVSAPVVTNQYTSIDCGSVIVPEAYKNALDYDYTNVSVYLPFIGIVPLNTREVMGSKISIRYRVDVLTGTCLATISVSRQSSNAVLYTFSGNCAVQIPLTSGNYGTLLTGLLSAVGGVAASVATGGAAIPAVAGVGSAIVNARTNVSRTGNLGSNAGALGVRIPYLIITRPIAYDAENYSDYYGYPANKTVILSSVSGYTRCKSVHVEGLPATEEEKTMIETALKNGVIF